MASSGQQKWLDIKDSQAIAWTNVDPSSKVFCHIHLRGLSQEVFMNLIHSMCSEITPLELVTHLPGVNELSTGCTQPEKLVI